MFSPFVYIYIPITSYVECITQILDSSITKYELLFNVLLDQMNRVV